MRKRVGPGSLLRGKVAAMLVVAAVVLAFGWVLLAGFTAVSVGGAGTLLLVGAGILALNWQQPARRTVPRATQVKASAFTSALNELHGLTPDEFQRVVGRLYEKNGYLVAPGEGADRHRYDLTVTKNRQRAIVLCRQTGAHGVVERQVVRELYEAMLYHEARKGFLVTNGAFSAPAIAWAQDKSIQLVDGTELVGWLRQVQTHNVSPS